MSYRYCLGESCSKAYEVPYSYTSSSLLDAYKEFQSPANIKALERTRSSATVPTPVPVVFPSSYPFSLVANAPPSKPPTPGVPPVTQGFFNPGLGEAAMVILALILTCPKKHLMGFLEASLEIEGQENFSQLLSKIFRVGISILNNEAFPKTWLNVNILAHKVLLKLTEPIALLMMKHFIPEQKVAYQFNSTLWRDGFFLLLKLLSSDQLVIEEFSPQVSLAYPRTHPSLTNFVTRNDVPSGDLPVTSVETVRASSFAFGKRLAGQSPFLLTLERSRDMG